MPHRAAICSTEASVRSSRSWARVMRWWCSHPRGLSPTSARIRRASWRALSPDSRARSCTVRGLSRWARAQSRADPSRSGHPRVGRRCDELGLAARTVRGHHQAPGQPVRGGGAVVAMDEVQAEVERRCLSGRGQYLAVVDVEHVGSDGDAGDEAGRAAVRASSAWPPCVRRADPPRRGRTPPCTARLSARPRRAPRAAPPTGPDPAACPGRWWTGPRRCRPWLVPRIRPPRTRGATETVIRPGYRREGRTTGPSVTDRSGRPRRPRLRSLSRRASRPHGGRARPHDPCLKLYAPCQISHSRRARRP